MNPDKSNSNQDADSTGDAASSESSGIDLPTPEVINQQSTWMEDSAHEPTRVQNDTPDANEFSDSLDLSYDTRSMSIDEARGKIFARRYEVMDELGRGGFGVVLLAFDKQLQRDVAIKIPHRFGPEDSMDDARVQLSLDEARTVAILRHPNIVRVFDLGSTDEHPLFIVSEYVEGKNLSDKLKQNDLAIAEIARIIAKIADALEYAHSKGIVHRDVKPSNILLDENNEPHLLDFGLASRGRVNEQYSSAGTPGYMSPELIMGRQHRVDHRSDIYSLGVTLYRCLTGRLPFRAKVFSELAAKIVNETYPPLGHLIENVPPELARIQDLAMAKRQSDRYKSAAAMAEDLRAFLTGNRDDSSRNRPTTQVVPQGLRAFTEHDAEFFLELLPGARDRHGFPQSIRFWKHKIEDSDQEQSFDVGVIFGPSGCGKSSFVKAGLIPNLSDDIIPIYVEATTEGTELRIRNAIASRYSLPEEVTSLRDTIKYLRDDATQTLGPNSRCLIVIDQFEQWLHHRHRRSSHDLVSALGNCDGQHVMAILMIRDDFWMATNRLMQELDIQIIEGGNSASVDLFDPSHAKKVLTLFGQANGDLPADASKITTAQLEFLELAISEMATENRIVCVRLALFAQMMKGRTWACETLRELGGSSGIGVQFLDETFGAKTARPNHRAMEQSARSVLSALLPDSGTEIKGNMRSGESLRTQFDLNPNEFTQLIHTLDNELRLITPIDLEAGDDTEGIHYQLTHDYLVPSLRRWLHRKQKETPGGRAEICLADRASLWETAPEKRHLPSLSETLSIRRWTKAVAWTPGQQAMMKHAVKLYLQRSLTVLSVVALIAVVGWMVGHRIAADRFQAVARAKVENLVTSKVADLPRLITEIKPYRTVADPMLIEKFQSPIDESEKLHAALALVDTPAADFEYLQQALLVQDPDFVDVIRKSVDRKSSMSTSLWEFLESANDSQQVLRAASGLAQFDPANEKWIDQATKISQALIQEKNPIYISKWMEMLKPAAHQLNPSLSEIFVNEHENYSANQVKVATTVLSSFAADDPELLLQLILDADQENLLELIDVFAPHKQTARYLVAKALAAVPFNQQLVGERKIIDAKRHANLYLLAIKLGQQELIWPRLVDSIDNSVKTEFVHSIADVMVAPQILIDQLTASTDPEIRQTLIFAVSELINRLSPKQTTDLSELMFDWFENDVDAGVHAASRWLLLNHLDNSNQKVGEIENRFSTGKLEGDRNWYLTKNGQTMTVINGPIEFWMGSTPETARDRDLDELRRERKINRSFAISQLEVTTEQFARFWNEREDLRVYYEYPAEFYGVARNELSAGRMNWFMAADYCNWLSQQEGIPEDQWCFPKHVDRINGITMLEDYFERTGYRLLSETEWEMACRDGTQTTWQFGSDFRRYDEFGWWYGNGNDLIRKPGLLKPNGLGLFDNYGNGKEWVIEGEQMGTIFLDDIVQSPVVTDKTPRILRGGSYSSHGRYSRSAYRESFTPDAADLDMTIRIGRTMPDQRD